MWFWLILGVLVMGERKNLIPEVPPIGFSLFGLNREAIRLGVDRDDLLVAIVLCSERARSLELAQAHRSELLAIAHSIYNRMRWPRTFGTSVWAVVMQGREGSTTATPGQFATGSVPTGELLEVLLQLAGQARTEHLVGEARGGPTHYHHHQGEKGQAVTAQWLSRGYVQVFPPGVGGEAAQFFAPDAERSRRMA